jgi:hypothetical protein
MPIMRGGLGYLFPDNNSFFNPGQFSRSRGFSLEADYYRQNASTLETLATSAVYGTGKFGLGVLASRFGTNFTQPANDTDTIGAGMGVTIANRLVLGAGYQAQTSSFASDSGRLTASIGLSPFAGQGFGITAIGSTNFSPKYSRSTQKGTIALGYSFRPNNTVEFFGTVNDFANATDDQAGLAFTLGNHWIYLGGFGAYNRQLVNWEARGRLGFVIAKTIDISGYIDKVIQTGSDTTYGGAFRASF